MNTYDDTIANPLRVAIIGTGNIGCDLLLKVIASPYLRCDMFAGRRTTSPGIELAENRGVPTSADGIDAIAAIADRIDLVFDATSAADAIHNYKVLEALGIPVVDLTPAHLGRFCVPALNLEECLTEPNVSMVSCGGQAAVPIAHCFSEASENGLGYLEIATASSSQSVGPATRANIDEYAFTTQKATHEFSRVETARTILIINPAEPGIVMRNTIAVPASENIDMEALRVSVGLMEKRINSYVPGYRVVVPPVATGDRIMVTIEVEGLGDWLPRYAGNLDVITCAAVAVAEGRAEARR
ncbi:acetaldehyde dehydrogenase (acetylating) [Streptomyces sp. NPDC002812]|uniref:acetaldehyde dehydrogenase (acetylating) n=1 Tax=unclassified Streptomyces TaxID=2593676 RepID=UPI00202FAAD6|nr:MULTISPECIES: acetaldehyde dehydrogenase (acetylating) [unclassified Streptomyces]MCM1969281.1 acetaldehyde dehydrogenase (acetylating) [Streptomyces sp. G1]MCX5122877.1 acetaldehyde dehydrogenase (acetylating) [Streptomyces sp. NBC_00347]MCX5296234.1 acetaldehyde dehydrogenase (acetylating) [Streptomyces sp. NBC_00193]